MELQSHSHAKTNSPNKGLFAILDQCGKHSFNCKNPLLASLPIHNVSTIRFKHYAKLIGELMKVFPKEERGFQK
jgi:hypothetical protein